MDPNGNLIWSKSYFRPNGVIHDAYVDPDGSFIVTGYTDSTTTSILEPLPAAFQPKLFMMKLSEGMERCNGAVVIIVRRIIGIRSGGRE